ncbi:Undecaprenyl-phosphate 4-deoxy-4-formamido-L-arabinose transferase [Aquisphaera giovannonii]|uniref:Undecaprenyl-phosphate 4-deoxy-4-formamido-L-arabinose transferase n=1 Tax=Aquisphaera giovannonii TaxID=406548 RepID=A0A5B9W2Q0_9BACT|nr:glycosyltransferase family 2 protein [Aquisphaera giovannonii]QEH34220.1 Undecaprenyl-phosphate 4-deoxy-4-formamido-L-arabinose transferase [Aquisphaera giovannonii]
MDHRAELELPRKPHLNHAFTGGLASAQAAGESRETIGVHPAGGERPVHLSFVIPVKDEEATLVELYERIADEVPEASEFEVIFIDDGSRDQSWQVIRSLAVREPSRVRGLRFRHNVGKASALTAGFRAARGGVVFTMDADLQDDPKEIRRFLAKLEEGYDLVSGWKKVRHDPWHKVLPSRVFNLMLSRVSRVHLHDHNCGFKCYRAEVLRGMTLHGELHRMVPALAAVEGFRSAEIVVQHHPRRHGVSKYGFERYIRGLMDMVTVGFLRKYRERPSHFIGAVSAACAAAAGLLLAAAAVLALARLPLAAGVSVLCGAVMLGTAIVGAFCGLLAEMSIRGGLANHWRLPIVEDTGRDLPPTKGQQPRVSPVPVSYRFRSTDIPANPVPTP